MKSFTSWHIYAFLISASLNIIPAAPLAKNSPSQPEDNIVPSRCHSNPCGDIVFENPDHVCGDWRLGPVRLPRRFPVSNELTTYSRFGNLCPAEFLTKWAGSTRPSARYVYPPNFGFAVDSEMEPIKGNATLTVGRKLDRFGGPTGNFLAPLGSPYIERALPPNNLLPAKDGKYPYNYHVYRVLREFEVQMGPIASWFEQPGLGTQFLADRSVEELIAGGFLEELSEDQFDEPVEYSYDPPKDDVNEG